MITKGIVVQVIEFAETRAIEVLCETSFKREWFEVSRCKVGRQVRNHHSFRLQKSTGFITRDNRTIGSLESCHFIQCPSKEFKNGRWIQRKVVVDQC